MVVVVVLKKNFSETIFYKTPLGEEKSVDSSEIYSHFLKLNFSSEILKESIQQAKLCTDPIGNIFRYIEGICQRLEISKAKKNLSASRKLQKESCVEVISVEDLEKNNLAMQEMLKKMEEDEKIIELKRQERIKLKKTNEEKEREQRIRDIDEIKRIYRENQDKNI